MLIVLCAEEEEARHINCHRVDKVIVTGVGVANILKFAATKFSSKDKIINVGYVGSNKYPIGTVISVNRVERLYKPAIIDEPTFYLTPCYVDDICFTVDDFVETPYQMEIPLIDMELYYLTARYPNIESIKIVSDNLNLTEHRESNLTESWELVNRILEHV